MKLVCYYEEVNSKSKELSETGLCIFDTKDNDIYEFIPFSDGNYEDDEIPNNINVTTTDPIFEELKHSCREESNPDYQEDDDGNPVDEDEEPIIDVYYDIKIWAFPQNALHLLGFSNRIYHNLHKICKRLEMRQTQNIEALAKMHKAPTLDEIYAQLRR